MSGDKKPDVAGEEAGVKSGRPFSQVKECELPTEGSGSSAGC